ncbi:hypothetical protein MA117_004559 [Escherichia coli]|nr:hypothetical protein [Escherichia coli]
MKIFLCSLYYESKRVTGANKRFDYFGKYLARNEEVSLTVIVRDGEIPSWATDAIVLPKYQYLPPLFRRILYWLHLSKIFFKCDCHPSDNKAIIAIDGKALLLFFD